MHVNLSILLLNVLIDLILDTKKSEFTALKLTLFPHVDPPHAPGRYHKQKYFKTPTLMGQ